MASYESHPLPLIEINGLKIDFPIEHFVYGSLRESFVNLLQGKKKKLRSERSIVDISQLKIKKG